MIKNILRSLFAPVVGSSDHEDRWVNLDDLGVWTYHTTKDTLGKKVHFHLTRRLIYTMLSLMLAATTNTSLVMWR
jgi:hypothetical protein